MAEDPKDITDQEFYVDDLRQSRRLAEDLERAEQEIKDLLAERSRLRAEFLKWIPSASRYLIITHTGGPNSDFYVSETALRLAIDRILPEER